MAEIVKLTNAFVKGIDKHYYINLDNVIAIYTDKSYNCTVLTTVGGQKSYVVTETPEEIMQLAKKGNDKQKYKVIAKGRMSGITYLQQQLKHKEQILNELKKDIQYVIDNTWSDYTEAEICRAKELLKLINKTKEN